MSGMSRVTFPYPGCNMGVVTEAVLLKRVTGLGDSHSHVLVLKWL